MPRIQFGPSVTGIRGSLAGLTFSANASGAYVKAYGIPVKRRSEWQETIRERMSYALQCWSVMGAPQRALWEAWAAAPSEPDFDPWGVQFYLSGSAWFVRVMLRQTWTLQATPAYPPSAPRPTALSDLALDIRPYTVGNSYITWSAPSIGANDYLYAELALSNNPTNVRPKSHYLVIAASQAAESPLDITLITAYRYGALIPGQQAYLRAWYQDELGQRSLVAETNSTVADT